MTTDVSNVSIGTVTQTDIDNAIKASKERLPHKGFGNNEVPKIFNFNLYTVIVTFLQSIIDLGRIRDLNGLVMLNVRLIKATLRCIFFQNNTTIPNPDPKIKRRVTVINMKSPLINLILQKTGITLRIDVAITVEEFIRSFPVTGQVISMPREQLQKAIDQLDIIINVVKARCTRSGSRTLTSEEVTNFKKFISDFSTQFEIARRTL